MSVVSQNDISTILAILQQIPLMAELNEQDHLEVIKRISLEYFPAEYAVFHEGDAGDAFYIIKKGSVKVFHELPAGQDTATMAMPGSASPKEAKTLGSNDFFGEMALISEKPRNATVQTLEECEVFKLRKEDFIQLVSSTPGMASRISDEFLKRLKSNSRSQEESPS